MEKIASAKDLKRGESIDFKYKGKDAILIKTMQDKFVAFSKVCPHERGTIVWDSNIKKLLCECHLSIFNDDGSVYRFSSVFPKMDPLTPIELKINEKEEIFAF